MAGINGGMNHHDDMSMTGMSPLPPNGTGSGNGMHMHHKMMMHMTFFWGKNAEILFSGWPGSNTGMYALALIVVFVLSVLVEWLSYCGLIKPGTNNVVAGLVQMVMHSIRVGFAYLIMLALMSFNAGVFIVAVAGHSVGFLIFGSRVFKQTEIIQLYVKASDLPPMSC